LNKELGREDLSEEDFRKFINEVFKNNPACFYIPDDHILRKTN